MLIKSGIFVLSVIIGVQPICMAQSRPNNQKEILSHAKFSQGNDLYGTLTVIRFRPGIMVTAVNFPKKFTAQVNKIFCISPSGKQYTPVSLRQIPGRDLKDYFLTISRSSKGWESPLFQKLTNVILSTAYAQTDTAARDTIAWDESAGTYLALMGLIGFAAGESDVWFTVGVFHLEEELGRWDVPMICYQEGRRYSFTGGFSIE